MASRAAVGPFLGAALGVILIVIGIASFPLADWLVRRQVEQRVQLVNGTEGYEIWRKPDIPIFLQIWVFNLTNPEDVVTGGKPAVVEHGPYTYREEREKVDLEYNDNGTVTYRQIKTYHFVRELSIGWDTETFTSVNIPYMTLLNGVRWNKGEQVLVAGLLVLFAKQEQPFITRTVREVVWGYTDPILQFLKKLNVDKYPTDFVGVLAGKNNTDDGIYTVFTGVSNISMLGVIDKYNGSRYLDFWSTPYANMVNGTDGTVGPPFISKTLVVKMFSTDICRSVYGTYHGDVTTLEGINLYRFTSPRSAMASACENPNNAGFCVPPGVCMGTGVLNVSTCQIVDSYHLPIVVSAPHFYMADKKYIDGVTNMKPDPKQHSTNIDIEPNTGFVMQINKRIQINVYVEPSPEFPQAANFATVVLPVLWLNESAMTDESHAQRLKSELLVPMRVILISQYVVLATGAVVLSLAIISVTFTIRCKRRSGGRSSKAADPDVTVADDVPILQS